MSDEEKTIENLRKNKGVSFAEADIILNLIAKQQTEIEELKDKNASLQKEINLMKSININDNYIKKDKIREKIEILEKLLLEEDGYKIELLEE